MKFGTSYPDITDEGDAGTHFKGSEQLQFLQVMECTVVSQKVANWEVQVI